jgi:uncharacterized protein YciI
MLILFVCRDAPDSCDLRRATRVEHLRYMIASQDRIRFGGPFLDGGATPVGSLIVMEFDSLDDAQAWLRDEPYNRAGLFAETIVAPMRQIMPEPEPHTLENELRDELAQTT